METVFCCCGSEMVLMNFAQKPFPYIEPFMTGLTPVKLLFTSQKWMPYWRETICPLFYTNAQQGNCCKWKKGILGKLALSFPCCFKNHSSLSHESSLCGTLCPPTMPHSFLGFTKLKISNRVVMLLILQASNFVFELMRLRCIFHLAPASKILQFGTRGHLFVNITQQAQWHNIVSGF